MPGKTRRRWRAKKMRVYERDNGRCFWCERRMETWDATIDHIVPQARGGGHAYDNIVLACRPCNEDRGDKIAEVYLFERLMEDAL